MRTCKICKTKFTPTYSKVQQVCSVKCSYEYTKKQKEKKARSEKKFKKMNNPNVYNKELKKVLQDEVNKIVRLIDKGTRCIDCHRLEAPQWDAGHFRSRGDEPKLRYHLDNIFKQSCYCNDKSEGNKIAYLNGIDKMYGTLYANKVESLRKEIDTLKMPNSELPEKIKIARDIVRELRRADQTYPPKMRIKLREKFNKRLGIYK